MKNLLFAFIPFLFCITPFYAQQSFYQVEEDGVEYNLEQRMEKHQINGASY